MDLSIINKLIETYKLWQQYLPHFPKTSRYTLGAKIDRFFLKILDNINLGRYLSKENKLKFIQKASANLDSLKFFLRIAWEIQALNTKQYAALSEKLNEIGRMMGGWIKKLEEKLPPKAGE